MSCVGSPATEEDCLSALCCWDESWSKKCFKSNNTPLCYEQRGTCTEQSNYDCNRGIIKNPAISGGPDPQICPEVSKTKQYDSMKFIIINNY